MTTLDTGVKNTRKIIARAEEIARTPAGQWLLKNGPGAARRVYAKVKDIGEVSNFLSSKVETDNPSKKNKMNLFQEAVPGQGTTQTFASLGKYRPSTSRVRGKVLSERKGFSQGFLTSDVGKQGAVSIAESMSATALRALYVNVPGADQGHNGYFEPISQVSKLYLTNYDVGNVILYIYDFVARRDSNINPLTAAQDINNSSAGQGFGITVPGQTLFDCLTFTNLFKIWKVTRVELRPGQSHIHMSRVFHTRKLNGKDFLSELDAVTNENVRGVTTGTFVLTQALPVVDANSTATNYNDDAVTFGTARVAYVSSYTQSIYVYPNQGVRQVTVNQPLATIVDQFNRNSEGTGYSGSN
jgi:hypothetical protein